MNRHDLKVVESPNFNAEYKKQYCGSPGLYKVFVSRLFDTLCEAIQASKESRIHSVPSKYRDSCNSEQEIGKEQAKRRRIENKQDKQHMDAAKRMNMDLMLPNLTSVAKSDHSASSIILPEEFQIAPKSAPTSLKKKKPEVSNASKKTKKKAKEKSKSAGNSIVQSKESKRIDASVVGKKVANASAEHIVDPTNPEKRTAVPAEHIVDTANPETLEKDVAVVDSEQFHVPVDNSVARFLNEPIQSARVTTTTIRRYE